MRALATAMLLGAVTQPGCTCAPAQHCQLVRALCRIDLCVRTDKAGWAACQGAPESCTIEPHCVTHAECLEDFMSRCSARMAPGAAEYTAYVACSQLDCSPRTPAPPADAVVPPDPEPPADAALRPPDAGAFCAGVSCGGSCCTAYACFTGKGCTCVSGVAACHPPDTGEPNPAITPSCCSDAPLCSAQNKLCCFVPAPSGLPAQTRCLTRCSSEARHCTFAPYLQSDGARSCLPPPHDTAGLVCPF